MADTITLDGFRSPVTVDLARKITKEKLLQFPAFRIWKDTLQKNLELQYTDKDHAFYKDPYVLKSIEIQSVDYFTPTKIGFVKLIAEIRNENDKKLPGIAFLRGGSVAMLMVLRPVDSRDERWVVMTEQPRVPAGSLKFVEIPAGMLDDAGDFSGQAAKEIEEETGFKLPKSELIDLTKLALSQSTSEGEDLQDAMYPSPGGSDEFIPIFLWEKVLPSLRAFMSSSLTIYVGAEPPGNHGPPRKVDREQITGGDDQTASL
jgi:ADP-sugar diphosphatase